jgi:hypothetical protein
MKAWWGDSIHLIMDKIATASPVACSFNSDLSQAEFLKFFTTSQYSTTIDLLSENQVFPSQFPLDMKSIAAHCFACLAHDVHCRKFM